MIARIVFVVFALALSSLAVATDPLILVSIDGFHPSYLNRGDAPTLRRFAREGVQADWMNPSYPSLTFPNHYTLVTGLRPDHHGIVGNDMADPLLGRFSLHDRTSVGDGRWWGGEPIWVGVRKAGGIAATMFWPGSEAQINGFRPDYWFVYDESISASARVDQVLAWLDLPQAQRPQLITLYFEQVDHAGHDFGPQSRQRHVAVRSVDAALDRLARGLRQRALYDRVNLVIVSDHGMTKVLPEHIHALDDLVDVSLIDVISEGPALLIAPKAGHEDAVRSALLGKHTDIECWDRAKVPPQWHYGSHPRIPAIVCQNTLGARTMLASTIAHWAGKTRAGTHGYDPYAADMRALFIARGPAFRRGVKLPPFDNVHVYPLLAHLLGIHPAANDGDLRVLTPALR